MIHLNQTVSVIYQIFSINGFSSNTTLYFACLVSISVFIVQGRLLKLNSSDIDDQFLISDGVDHHHHDESKSSTALAATITCDHQYSFLPSAENIPGYMFQVFVYQLLLKSVGQIDRGSKELFNIIGETKVGGIIFRFLMALPSMIFIILSGAFGSKENAQSTVRVGVGIFAGITVFSLTFQWGIILMLGSRKLKVKSNDNAQDSTSSCLPGREQLIKLKDDGVGIDEMTRKTGGIMLLSLIPYAIVQLDNIFRSSSANHVITIAALIVSVLLLASYFLYQVTSAWMQERSLAYAKYDILKERFLQHIQCDGQFLTKDGKVDTDAIHNLFKKFDRDGNGFISKSEVREFISSAGFGEIHRRPEEIVNDVFNKFDGDKDGTLNKSEFEAGILVIAGKQLPYNSWILVASLIRVILGVVIMTLLGGPLMNNILSLSYAVGLPSFSTSFVIVPITMNIRALAAAIVPAKKKDEESASLTFSEIYSSVIMNNIVGLTSLLFIVYFKGLTWDFSAEVLTILFVCAIIGVMAYKSDSYPLWTSIVAILLYPASWGFYYLTQVFWGWN